VNWNLAVAPAATVISNVSKYLYPVGPVISMNNVVVIVEPGFETSTSNPTEVLLVAELGPETRS